MSKSPEPTKGQSNIQPLTYQKKIFPVDILTEYPNTQGSADLKLIVNGRDGKDYAVKKPNDGKGKVPASELLCYELAYRVTIPTPSWAFINLSDGDIGFGSVWEGGVAKIAHINQIISILQYKVKVNNLKVFLSRLYAFDLFVNNVDRHWGNYLWRESYDQSFITLAFDFSRACFETGHDKYDAFDPGCNTQSTFTLINLTMNYDRQEAIKCLDDLLAITPSEIEDMIKDMPHTWMTASEKKSYIDWWASSARTDRIATIKGKI
ncbi:HipA family kinase [Pseudomonas sp. ML96]|uniref:HipA family kinase n=1 Tax=Pseudomonas sp. ML96 TaxID=1523503 RepID=UPI0005BA4FC0|nr:HipA family kinase [Pseudomonas sp. ML96]